MALTVKPKNKGKSKTTRRIKTSLPSWAKEQMDTEVEKPDIFLWREPVKYIRGSATGDPCIRSLAFDMLGHHDPKEARVLRIFRTGNLIEQTNIEIMEKAGMLDSAQEEIRYDYFNYEEDKELVKVPFILGHYDAIVKRKGDGTKHLVEIKSINERAFGKLPAEHGPMLAGMSPVFNQFPKYIHQWNTYAACLEMDEGFLLFEAKNTQRQKYYFLNFDKDLFEKNIRKIEEAWGYGINEEIPPIPEGFNPLDPKDSGCGWCDKKPLCKELSKDIVKLADIKEIDEKIR